MGSGISAATTMGRLRTATSTLADLDLPPTELLHHLDKITADLEQYATCAYAVYDPHRALCHIAVAGHLPPVLMRAGESPELLDLPTGAPLGVGGVAFEATTFGLAPGDQLVLYTDGLVETRHHAIDERLTSSSNCSTAPTDPRKKPATGSWTHCAIRTTTTMLPYSSPVPDAGPGFTDRF